MKVGHLSRLGAAAAAVSVALGTYWLFIAQPPGLPIPRQILLGLSIGTAFFMHGCGVGYRRERLLIDGKVDHGYVTKLIVLSLSLATTLLAVALPSLFLLATYAIEGTSISAPEVEARLPSGYSVGFVLGIGALGGIITTAYAVYGYLDHVNTG